MLIATLPIPIVPSAISYCGTSFDGGVDGNHDLASNASDGLVVSSTATDEFDGGACINFCRVFASGGSANPNLLNAAGEHIEEVCQLF
jgi:hypothetical protein